jgi:hypothetical protein
MRTLRVAAFMLWTEELAKLYSLYSSTLKMEAIHSSETSVHFTQPHGVTADLLIVA